MASNQEKFENESHGIKETSILGYQGIDPIDNLAATGSGEATSNADNSASRTHAVSKEMKVGAADASTFAASMVDSTPQEGELGDALLLHRSGQPATRSDSDGKARTATGIPSVAVHSTANDNVIGRTEEVHLRPADQASKSSSSVQSSPRKMRSNFRLPISSKGHITVDSTDRSSGDPLANLTSLPTSKVITFSANGTAIAQDKRSHDANERIPQSEPAPSGSNRSDPRWSKIDQYLKTTNGDERRAVTKPAQGSFPESNLRSTNRQSGFVATRLENPRHQGMPSTVGNSNRDQAPIGFNGDTTSQTRRHVHQTEATSNPAHRQSQPQAKQGLAPKPRHYGLPTKTPKPRGREEIEKAKKMKEDDALMQPIAQMLGGYYLLDDERLVEENISSANPTSEVSEVMTKQVSLPHPSSLMIHQIPPRIVGGLQDRVQVKKITCNCKVSKRSSRSSGDACLKLYCDCFAIGEYCGEHCRCCSSCFNSATESNVQPRTEAIVEALKKDPSAFRHAHTKMAQLQKERRIQLIKAGMKPTKPQNQANKRLPLTKGSRSPDKGAQSKGSEVVRGEMITTQLQPSHYAVPLKVDNGSTVLTGLSFSLTHPRNRKKTKSFKKPVERKGQLDAMQVKAKLASGTKSVALTELEEQWNLETERTSAFFQSMRARENPVHKPRSWHPFEETQKEATVSYATINDDINSVRTVATAARVDTMARFYQESRLKRGFYYAPETTDNDVTFPDSSKRRKGNSLEDEAIVDIECQEELEPLERTFPSVSEAQMKEMTILVAQDTAMLQETSRIVRGMARELCARRKKTDLT